MHLGFVERTHFPEAARLRWSMVMESLTRAYPVTLPMVALGAFLAMAAYALFLRGCSRRDIPLLDRRLAPVLLGDVWIERPARLQVRQVPGSRPGFR